SSAADGAGAAHLAGGDLRADHLRRLLRLWNAKDPRLVLQNIASEITEKNNLNRAADQHLLAVIHHRLAMTVGASASDVAEEKQGANGATEAALTMSEVVEGHYREAKARYQKEATKDRFDPMYALCCADWAYYEFQRANFDRAASLYEEA